MEFTFEIVRSMWEHRGEAIAIAVAVGVLAVLDAVFKPGS